MATENLTLHATCAKATASLTAKGDKTYKLAFEYPVEFLDDVDALIGERVDVYWNEEMVALGAEVVGTSAKRQKDADPIHTVTIDADAGDTERYNLANEVGKAGDVRLRLMQTTAFSRP